MAVASVGAVVVAVYLVVRPPWPLVRPLMIVDVAILSLFWIWHLILMWRRRGAAKLEPASAAMSAGIAVSAMLLALLGLWGISLLHRSQG